MLKKIVSLVMSFAIIASMTVVMAKEQIKAGEYAVPYVIQNAYNQSLSMADESRNGDMIVTINADGSANYIMNVKARTQENLIGHILELWNIPSTEVPSGAPSDYEKDEEKAKITATVNEKGLDGTKKDYASQFTFSRTDGAAEYFYARVNVDAMGDSHQNAKVVMDWSKAKSVESASTVKIDLWNSVANQASMGAVAVANNSEALVIGNTLYLATNPVDVSGYTSALTSIKFDEKNNGIYKDVDIIKTDVVNSGTKHDGTDHEITYIAVASLTLPDYIKKTGIEYIPVKMQVPYTPMDAVAVGTDGYLDARIKIDWSTLAKTTKTELVQNPTKASGTSSITGQEIKDISLKSMGVTLEADTEKVDEKAVFNVSKVTDANEINTAKNVVDGEFTLYKFGLSVDGKEFTPNGSVKLSMPYSEGMAVYRVNSDGTKTVLKIKNENGKAVVTTTSLGNFAIVGADIENSGVFTDMKGHWAEDYVNTAVDMGLFYGVSDTLFAPENKMTNGMVITVLYRIAGEPQVDASGNMWYDKAVKWGEENKIIGDYGTLPFNPEENVTREAFATMLYRYHTLEKPAEYMGYIDGFEDKNSVSEWAKEAFEWAYGNDVISGKSDAQLAPKDNATRAEVATMLVRYMK